jgi:co-chaperonin GroES (HSP10)
LSYDADEITSSLGNIDDITLFRNQVLVAIAIRSNEITLSDGKKFYLPQKTVDEDRYQSKVGLIVAIGPGAFVEDEGKWFNGMKCKVGDWIMYRPSDGWSVDIYGADGKTKVPCRMLDDTSVRAILTNPGRIW